MPRRPARPCRNPTCPNLEPCPLHKRNRYPHHDQRSNARYSNPEYRTNRAKAWERDAGRCRWIGCNQKATSVHHVIPIELGGTHDVSNLVCVCRMHHEEAERLARGEGGPFQDVATQT